MQWNAKPIVKSRMSAHVLSRKTPEKFAQTKLIDRLHCDMKLHCFSFLNYVALISELFMLIEHFVLMFYSMKFELYLKLSTLSTAIYTYRK